MIAPYELTYLEASGPKNWHRTISTGHAHVSPFDATPIIMGAAYTTPPTRTAGQALATLTQLGAAATILAHTIASHGGYDSAREVYEECRRVAGILDNRTEGIETVGSRNLFPYVDAIYSIAQTYNSDIITWLLVDIIRIASTITKD